MMVLNSLLTKIVLHWQPSQTSILMFGDIYELI